MKMNNIIHGPIIQAHSGMIYSITLLSGRVVTNPEGFSDIENAPSINKVKEDNIPRIEDYAKDPNKKEIHV